MLFLAAAFAGVTHGFTLLDELEEKRLVTYCTEEGIVRLTTPNAEPL